MSWLRIDDGFDEHPKIEPLSDRAFRVHVAGLCLCSRKLSDGHVSGPAVKGIIARLNAGRKHVDELVDAGLWLPAVGGGFMVNDFLTYNRSAEVVKEDRRKARDRQARFRGSNGVTDGVTDDVTNTTPSLTQGKSRSKTFADAEKSEPVGRVRVTAHDVPKKFVDFATEAVRLQAMGKDVA